MKSSLSPRCGNHFLPLGCQIRSKGVYNSQTSWASLASQKAGQGKGQKACKQIIAPLLYFLPQGRREKLAEWKTRYPSSQSSAEPKAKPAPAQKAHRSALFPPRLKCYSPTWVKLLPDHPVLGYSWFRSLACTTLEYTQPVRKFVLFRQTNSLLTRFGLARHGY